LASSLIRGKYVISRVVSRTDVQLIADGAVFQRDGKVVEVGPYDDLATRYQPDEVLGSPEHVVMPGFTNGHHHVGLTPRSARLAGSGTRALVRHSRPDALC
jgi:cytosine/adenosine deaminase-related metal-dependent hydrolase